MTMVHSILFGTLNIYAPVKVSHCSGRQAYDSGLSDHTGDSDNSNSGQRHSDIILTLQMLEI